MRSNLANTSDTLMRLADVIETRKPANGGDPEKSYVARLLQKGPDAFLKKIGEEATETVMAAKDIDNGGGKPGFFLLLNLIFYGLLVLPKRSERKSSEPAYGWISKVTLNLRLISLGYLPASKASPKVDSASKTMAG